MARSHKNILSRLMDAIWHIERGEGRLRAVNRVKKRAPGRSGVMNLCDYTPSRPVTKFVWYLGADPFTKPYYGCAGIQVKTRAEVYQHECGYFEPVREPGSREVTCRHSIEPGSGELDDACYCEAARRAAEYMHKEEQSGSRSVATVENQED